MRNKPPRKCLARKRLCSAQEKFAGGRKPFDCFEPDSKLEIDNNLVENTIRPIAIGRKNYLFAGSHAAAERAAIIYSILGTCKPKGVEPFQWLKNIFDVIPDHKANKLEELLP